MRKGLNELKVGHSQFHVAGVTLGKRETTPRPVHHAPCYQPGDEHDDEVVAHRKPFELGRQQLPVVEERQIGRAHV